MGYFLYLAVATLCVLALVELGLRAAGYPRGLFHYRPLDGDTLYLPSARINIVMGPIPYLVETNSLGLRGKEIPQEKPDGVTRILMLGDSVTDGFYVSNAETYPGQLERMLLDEGYPVDVACVALGDSSIDDEFAKLKRYGMPLNPDIVVLTFVSNDIKRLETMERGQLVHDEQAPVSKELASEWFLFGRTAIGELLLDAAMRTRYPKYRMNREVMEGQAAPVIEGSTNFDDNARHFLEYHAIPTESIAGYEEYNAGHLKGIDNYIHLLGLMNDYCREHGGRLALSYHPDYPEIYWPDRKVPVRGMLRDACAAMGILFIDQLPAFRERAGEVLHFAPWDFHPNAEGNAAMAESVARGLQEAGWLPRGEASVYGE